VAVSEAIKNYLLFGNAVVHSLRLTKKQRLKKNPK
jgi:hypothetical protein